MAAQFTEINGLVALGLSRCRALAASSLPVPDSPCIRTVVSVGATLRIRVNTFCMGSHRPYMMAAGSDSVAWCCPVFSPLAD